MMTFRDATASDAEAIAHLHAESWRSAYRGILSSDFLENRVHQERREAWKARFSEAERRPVFVLLAENAAQLAGFACVFPDEDPLWGSYLDNLHVAPGLTGHGIGRDLLSEVARRLRQEGFTGGLYLWIIEQNYRARRFYEELGGAIVGSQIHTMADGREVLALRCHWFDPQALLLS